MRYMKTGAAAVMAVSLLLHACTDRNIPDATPIKILAVNDFHGQLPDGKLMNNRPAGGIPVLAAYMKKAVAENGADRTLIVLPGDQTGASPPDSGLLLDEPAGLFFNMFANGHCKAGDRSALTGCNMIATVGNHEFDRGLDELERKLNGGNRSTAISHIQDPYPGAMPYYILSNVKMRSGGALLLSPRVIWEAGGVRIGFIGAVTVTTQTSVMPDVIAGLEFIDEAQAINEQVAALKAEGIRAIVVALHEGGTQTAYDGPTQSGTAPTGRIADIVPALDGEVDVVLSGHSHKFTNAYIKNAAGRDVLVTQAYCYSTAYADVDITVSGESGDIIGKTARIVITYADQSPGNGPDAESLALLGKADKDVAPVVNQPVGTSSAVITATQNDSGESPLGDLVADSMLASTPDANVAFINTGAIRADLPAGQIIWGDAYSVLPFGNVVVVNVITGDQIRRVLEQQWTAPYNLAVAGLTYTYSASAPAGSRVQQITIGGVPVDPGNNYTAVINDYLDTGGDTYTVFDETQFVSSGELLLDALINHIKELPQPFMATTDGRIKKIN
ncbi:MAG: bifunctional metallophosphatase/5'-nucleotidase [Myxococcota bacterium]|jgi:5'-nucleotidase